MEKFNLKRRILLDIENLISESSPEHKVSLKFEKLHVAILKRHYNATDVSIDYQRRRVVMDIVMDDHWYDPKTINTDLPTFRANLWFRNLADFLKSCLEQDHRSLAFYASLLKSYQNNDRILVA